MILSRVLFPDPLVPMIPTTSPRSTEKLISSNAVKVSLPYSRRADRWRASQDPRDATTEQLRAVDAVVVSIAHASALPEGVNPQPQVEVEGSEVNPKPQVELEGPGVAG